MAQHRPSAARRRDALLDAATEIVGESGPAAATHRAIAARAGVPLATTSYFFSSVDELIAEATRRFTSARAAEITALAAALPDEATPDEIATRYAELLLTGERSMELAQIEAYLHAARGDELREAVAGALRAFEEAAGAALSAAGAHRPEEAARAFVALVDGFVLQHLARPRPSDQADLAAALRALLAGYVNAGAGGPHR